MSSDNNGGNFEGNRKRWKGEESEEHSSSKEDGKSELGNSSEEDSRRSETDNNDRIEEKCFADLFVKSMEIFRKNAAENVQNEDIKEAITSLKSKFKSHQYMEVDFDESKNLIAYFQNYSILNSAIARNRFLNALKNCQELRKAIKKCNLNIVSLGGGPGTDMLGFCCALQEFKIQASKIFNLNIVDVCKRWRSFHHIIQFLLEEKLCSGSIRAFYQNNVVNSSFMCVNLIDTNPPMYYSSALEKADIILLVRVLDGLDFSKTEPNDMLQNIVSRMKGEALLLLVDSVWKGFIVGMDHLYSSDLPKFEMADRAGLANSSQAQISVYKKNKKDD